MYVPACTINIAHTISKFHITIQTHKDKETWFIFMNTQTSLQNKVELNILRLELLQWSGWDHDSDNLGPRQNIFYLKYLHNKVYWKRIWFPWWNIPSWEDRYFLVLKVQLLGLRFSVNVGVAGAGWGRGHGISAGAFAGLSPHHHRGQILTPPYYT